MSSVMLSNEQIAQLTPAQRLELIAVLWDSLDPSEAPLTLAQAAELERRDASYEQDRDDAEPWDTVRTRIEARLP